MSQARLFLEKRLSCGVLQSNNFWLQEYEKIISHGFNSNSALVKIKFDEFWEFGEALWRRHRDGDRGGDSDSDGDSGGDGDGDSDSDSCPTIVFVLVIFIFIVA